MRSASTSQPSGRARWRSFAERTPRSTSSCVQKYRKVFWICTTISFVLHVATAVTATVLFPTFDIAAAARKKDQIIIQMEDIPETQQIKRPPPPPRPAEPIETESEDVPDDVTIESTDIDFERRLARRTRSSSRWRISPRRSRSSGLPAPQACRTDRDEAFVDLPPPPPPGEAMEDEIMEFWKVEQKPVPIKTAPAVYPDIARKAELEGKVFVQFIVGTDGRVRNVRVLRGPEIFRKAAIDAVRQFVFRPAVQNDKPVQVQMVQPISFTLRK